MDAAGQEQDYNRVSHPVDLMERIACLQDWVFERSSEDELTVSVAGSWCDYHISFNWRDDLESLHMACAFDFKVPRNRTTEIYRLLVLINEQLWLGHFDIWSSEGLLLYRQGLMLNGAEPTAKQCEALPRLHWIRARGIIRLSSSWSGPVSAPRMRWPALFSKPRGKLERKHR